MKFTHPPSHIQDIVVSSNRKTKKNIQKVYGKDTTIFKLNIEISRIEITWDTEYDCPGGLISCIDSNDNVFSLFDSTKHGYNGQNEIFESNRNFEIRKIDLKSCTIKSEVILAFQYTGEEKEYSKVGNSDKLEDYFTWVIIYHKCDKELSIIFEFECA